MTLQIDFEFPVFISASKERDILSLTVIEGNIFKSAQTHLTIEDLIEMKKTLPTQLPDNKATDVLDKGAKAVHSVTTTAIISNFVINILISGSLNLLWGMINCLQIISYFPLINVLVPANC